MLLAFAQKVKRSVGSVLLMGFALYVLIGLLFTAGSLYCYNVRNWDMYGGFSLPPLFLPVGFVLDLFLWPLHLWANLVNGLGMLGSCRPL
jgi:hypothetical protein